MSLRKSPVRTAALLAEGLSLRDRVIQQVTETRFPPRTAGERERLLRLAVEVWWRWEEVQAGILLKTGEFEKNILPITKPVSACPSLEEGVKRGGE